MMVENVSKLDSNTRFTDSQVKGCRKSRSAVLMWSSATDVQNRSPLLYRRCTVYSSATFNGGKGGPNLAKRNRFGKRSLAVIGPGELIRRGNFYGMTSTIGRMTKDIKATPSLWHMAGDTSQPVARPVGCTRLMLVFLCLGWYWIRGESWTHVQPQLFFARRPFLWLLVMPETGCKSELLVWLGVQVKHLDIKKYLLSSAPEVSGSNCTTYVRMYCISTPYTPDIMYLLLTL